MKNITASLKASLSFLSFICLMPLPLQSDSAPAAPSQLYLTAQSSSEVAMSWRDHSSDETGFKIYRNGQLILVTGKNSSFYTDIGLSPNTTYTYEIKATNDTPTWVSANVTKNIFASNETIMVDVANMPGGSEDWLGIFYHSSRGPINNENLLAWNWMDSKTNGIVNVNQLLKGELQPGHYEVRAFFNNTYNTEAISYFTVADEEIQNGYGKWGNHAIGEHTFNISTDYDNDKQVKTYFPDDIENIKPAPGILFAPGGLDDDGSYGDYEKLLKFIASKGYIVYYVSHTYNTDTIHDQIYQGFTKALQADAGYVDTTRIGLVGFSSGAGSLPSIGYKLFHDDGLGSNGRFIFSLSPGLDYGISDFMGGDGQYALTHYPQNTYMLMQIYDHTLTNQSPHNANESLNDPRNIVDIYETINISDTNKEFNILRSRGYGTPNHYTCMTAGEGSADDALDTHAIFKPFDALADLAFNNNANAKYTALGDGLSNNFVYMSHSDDPVSLFRSEFGEPKNTYDYQCDRPENARRAYCENYFQ